ncbi:hypothetical protein NEOC65_000902 [Neochlamydia sp. AcF65]|nr:hypothetical protein [Neochlamydia sp. AcF65]MBS4169436.1 hypothetical protein [Neochlamydia sp. AcF95]NGY94813.1 hypothetical protein [Neochlamydia sp. AcF84]
MCINKKTLKANYLKIKKIFIKELVLIINNMLLKNLACIPNPLKDVSLLNERDFMKYRST